MVLPVVAELAFAHYGPPPCLSDERELIIQQASKWVGCFHQCSSDSGCPQSIRHLQTSSPGLQSVIACSVDTGDGKYCGELCKADADCDTDSGAACKDGLCLFPPQDQWPKSWQWHILPWSYTGPANKDLAEEVSEIGFIAYKKDYSDYNVEEHVTGTVVEFVEVFRQSLGQYLSCCPPTSKTNPSPYYRCNSWTTDANNNCHTTGLPWNDGRLVQAGRIADVSTTAHRRTHRRTHGTN